MDLRPFRVHVKKWSWGSWICRDLEELLNESLHYPGVWSLIKGPIRIRIEPGTLEEMIQEPDWRRVMNVGRKHWR